MTRFCSHFCRASQSAAAHHKLARRPHRDVLQQAVLAGVVCHKNPKSWFSALVWFCWARHLAHWASANPVLCPLSHDMLSACDCWTCSTRCRSPIGLSWAWLQLSARCGTCRAISSLIAPPCACARQPWLQAPAGKCRCPALCCPRTILTVHQECVSRYGVLATALQLLSALQTDCCLRAKEPRPWGRSPACNLKGAK